MKKKFVKMMALLLVISSLVAAFTVVVEAASYATGKYVITAKSGLNLRSGPGSSYKVVTAIPTNTVVNVTKISGTWGYTSYNNRSGWISMQYTAKYTEPAPVYTPGTYIVKPKNALNVRSGPGTSYKVVTTLPRDTVVTVTKISGSWGYITHNNHSGWISMEYAQPYSTPSTQTKSFRATSGWNVNVSGVVINAGDIFYTWNRSGTQKSTSGNYNVYAYAKVKGSLVYVASAQCMAFARYTQELLYGANDGTDASKFNKQYYSNYSQQTAAYIKNAVTAAGSGAHLRVKYNGHSMVVVNVDNNGFYYIDANAGNKANQICIGYITWSDFKSQWKNIYMISTFKG